jgi:hypothetical protein
MTAKSVSHELFQEDQYGAHKIGCEIADSVNHHCKSQYHGVINMPFPEKFRALIELREGQVSIPDYVWLSYAVCAVDEESCGWGGWIIESAWKTTGEAVEQVRADTDQRCPVCGEPLFRTEIEKQFRFNPDAAPKIDYPYETVPIKFAKSKPTSSAKKAR